MEKSQQMAMQITIYQRRYAADNGYSSSFSGCRDMIAPVRINQKLTVQQQFLLGIVDTTSCSVPTTITLT